MTTIWKEVQTLEQEFEEALDKISTLEEENDQLQEQIDEFNRRD